ncbi:unnamed protein product [Rotaria socialis]|uniref:Uncharacterized protein n=4 Tax=Rotaria socialis TaxID=392032 RepID=A0A820EE61_9BILA|nr:unnamed protein product [Rotaria socialis]CAF3380949.1 unnamed protein product [Rotaria socialis]CAF3440788.1 unnamed protein product [Rotaria socialis]CAF3644583.1 unnamed protein product [Rotaria socialis]CAF4240749.1 unnamed protein product [Rotaria socialis]
MALESYLDIKNLNSKVTVIGSNPVRRELVFGFEDGSVQTYDPDTGNMITNCYKHRGWVTALCAFPEARAFFSSGNDSTVVTYNAIGTPIDKLNIGSVAYSICFHSRLKQVIFGIPEGIQFHSYELNNVTGQIINSIPLYIICEHEDITTGVLMLDKLYSVGFDGKLIIYDCPFGSSPSVSKKLDQAHDAGITCLIAQKNSLDNNEWLMTGSFDKSAKVWSLDGKLIFKFVDFTQPVTGLTYVHATKTVWIAAGNSFAHVYDPKNGENVSSFIDTFLSVEDSELRYSYFLILLRYVPELNVLIASTNLKQCLGWRYKNTGCISCLKVKSPLESVCYTKKTPILMFAGDSEGDVYKWEQMQSNQIMYSSERLLKFEGKKNLSDVMVHAISLGDTKTNADNNNNKESTTNTKRLASANRIKTVEERLPAYYIRSRSAAKIRERERGIGGYVSQYAHLQKKGDTNTLSNIKKTATGKSILRILLVEKFDLIIAASEDKNIYIWGFDLEALKALTTLRDQANDLNHLPEEGADVANRVVGFTLRKIFSEHESLVTSLALVDDVDSFGGVFLLSSGWDRRIFIWDLTHFILFSQYTNPKADHVDEAQTASQGNIHDMDYSPHLKYFAYASSDMCVYVRKFSPKGSEMDLMYILQAKIDSEVTCVKWNFIMNQWVTGMENGEIRIWEPDGEFKQAINVRGSVHKIAIDDVQKALLIGTQDTLKVFDMEEYTCVQTNEGHTDVIRDVLFIPERSQYITVSLDHTMRIWNAWSPEPFRKKVADIDPKIKFSEDLWEQIRNCVKNSIEVEDANSIVDKYFQKQYEQKHLSIHDDHPRAQQVSFSNP